MSKVLLQMSPDKRRRIIAGMEFYLAQARKRLLVGFDPSAMEDEARTFAETHFHAIGRQFDPENHDVSDVADAAWEAAADFHIRLIDMRRETMLSIVAGMYHTWEKQLREWLVQEFSHSFDMTALRPRLWQKKTDDLFTLLTGLGISPYSEPFTSIIDECRLVVNVYKHAEGTSFEDLKARQPRYFGMALRDGSLSPYTAPEHLEVTDEDIGLFHQAISDFWKFLPDNVPWPHDGTVPDWFAKAVGTAG